jgi:hypothetical protein
MSLQELPWRAAGAPPAVATRSRQLAAALLRAASQALSRLADGLLAAPAPAPAPAPAAEPLLEFHAEAGAPEGALYMDGQFVALLPGVPRL